MRKDFGREGGECDGIVVVDEERSVGRDGEACRGAVVGKTVLEVCGSEIEGELALKSEVRLLLFLDVV